MIKINSLANNHLCENTVLEKLWNNKSIWSINWANGHMWFIAEVFVFAVELIEWATIFYFKIILFSRVCMHSVQLYRQDNLDQLWVSFNYLKMLYRHLPEEVKALFMHYVELYMNMLDHVWHYVYRCVRSCQSTTGKCRWIKIWIERWWRGYGLRLMTERSNINIDVDLLLNLYMLA